MNIKRKIIRLAIILCIAIVQMIIGKSTSKAIEVNTTTYLQRADKGFLSIQKWNGTQWMYAIHSITNFIDENGASRVAYCVNPDLNGIGYIDGEFEGYDVLIKEYLSDQRLWRVYTNGYPYKTYSELGVENEEDAYLATKQAAYAIIRGYSVDDVRALYRAGQDYVKGESLEDIQRRGQKIIDAMCKMVEAGYNGTDTMQTNNLLNIEELGELSEDSNNKEYYSQNYSVSCNVEFAEYKVESIFNFPEGSYIANDCGIEQRTFAKGEIFKVMIPKNKIDENIEGTVTVTANCKNYPMFYAESIGGNYQNYILCADSYSNDVQASTVTNIDAYKSKLQIFKADKDSGKPIDDVKFLLKYDNGQEIGTYTTDENGIICVENLKKGNVIVTELESNKEYTCNTNQILVNLEFNELKTITIENELKKGRIKIIKVDAENNAIRIPNVKFEIRDEKNKLIQELITDENGEVVSDALPIGIKYIIKETESGNEYELTDEVLTIDLQENEIKTLTFKNKRKQVQILPRTGSIDWSLTIWIVSSVIFSILMIVSQYYISKHNM